MERIENDDGTVTHRATKPNEDMRNFDSNGRFICNADHPWSGKRTDAPLGVRHEAAVERHCPHCLASW